MSADFAAFVEHAGRLPVTWLLATLVAYRLALAIQRRAKYNALAHPVAVSTVILVAVLSIADIDYATYFDGAQFIHFLLGPATVALAVPLHQQMKAIRGRWTGLTCAALLGSATAIVSATGLAALLGASADTVIAMAVKSVTMPIALGLTEKLGGVASLTSTLVMLTGVTAAAIAQGVLRRLGISDPDICGFSLGVSAHGIGTARALQQSSEMGAFAGLAMGMAGVLTAVLLPLALTLTGYL